MRHVRVLAIVGGRNVALPWSQAVVQVGLCSGVLVTHDAVLTSAHCLEGPVTSIRIADHLMGVATCVRHPGYRAGETKHDIGFCLLKAAIDVQPIWLDDGPALLVGASVTLAGTACGWSELDLEFRAGMGIFSVRAVHSECCAYCVETLAAHRTSSWHRQARKLSTPPRRDRHPIAPRVALSLLGDALGLMIWLPIPWWWGSVR